MAGLDIEQLKVLGVVGFYMFAAILMVTVNKWVLMSSSLPVFFVCCQLAMAVVLLLACHHLGWLTLPRWDIKVVKALWATVLVNAFGFIFNTLCIQYVDASFYQVARGLILPMTIGLAFATNASPPSYNCVLCCGVITLGFLIGVIWDNSVSLPTASLHGAAGIIFGILSSLTSALNAIIVRKNLPAVGGSAIALSWYSNLLTCMALSPFIIIMGETGPILQMLSDPVQLKTFVWGISLTGFIGFLISMAGLLSVKLTSPVTHMVSAALRGILQTAISVQVFGDVLSFPRLVSVAVILLGSCAYVWIKHIESPAKPPLQAAVQLEKEQELEAPLMSTPKLRD